MSDTNFDIRSLSSQEVVFLIMFFVSFGGYLTFGPYSSEICVMSLVGILLSLLGFFGFRKLRLDKA